MEMRVRTTEANTGCIPAIEQIQEAPLKIVPGTEQPARTNSGRSTDDGDGHTPLSRMKR